MPERALEGQRGRLRKQRPKQYACVAERPARRDLPHQQVPNLYHPRAEGARDRSVPTGRQAISAGIMRGGSVPRCHRALYPRQRCLPARTRHGRRSEQDENSSPSVLPQARERRLGAEMRYPALLSGNPTRRCERSRLEICQRSTRRYRRV